MMDETIANSKPVNWNRVTELEKSLVGIIGNPNFNHEIIHPIPCLDNIAGQLKGRKFSAVLDLTGWLSPAMQELLPNTPVEDRFSLSRVRIVSSPKLETTGYRISMSPDEIDEAKKTLDLSKPLIVDDVSFSGWTSRKAMNLWGINPKDATHAFLIANTGDLGNDLGAVPMLEAMGSKVVSGFEITTPQDDGWHLKDLHQNPNLEQSFFLALFFQEIIRNDGIESERARTFFNHETVIDTLFPDHLRSDQIRELSNQGKFVLKNGHLTEGEEIHARNPFLWASPYFQEHINIDAILENKDEVLGILTELRTLTIDSEGRREASLELRKGINERESRHEVSLHLKGKER